MNGPDLSSRLRDYVKSRVSPTLAERELVTRLYTAVRSALGENCYLVGSFARFTASRPIHDIDVLFVTGDFDESRLNPSSILKWLHSELVLNFDNPTAYKVNISPQTHSITICFLENDREHYAIDVVPALKSGSKNEFQHDIYWVPEILRVSRRNRRLEYEKLAKRARREADWWIKSDPRGYISEATALNARNADFRRVTKLVKKWKHNCCAVHPEFGLKSFHTEQAIANIFRQRPGADISEVLFMFFCDLPNMLATPQIPDRADRSKYIDQYVTGLTEDQKRIIQQARDFFLIGLENVSEQSSLSDLLQGGLHIRASHKEQYLFDSRIPVLTENDARLRVQARTTHRDGFRTYELDAKGVVGKGRKITFSAKLTGPYEADLLKWKVKNDNASPEPRGEITDHSTRNNPESTVYEGVHFVECYAVKQKVCIAKARQNVVIR